MIQVFGHGLDELKRRWQRRSLKKQLAGHDAARTNGLGQLGQRAIEAGVDLSDQAALRDHIGQLNARAGGVADATKALDAELAALQDRRRAEETTFDAQRAEIQTRKTPVDTALAAARNQQATHEATARAFQRRLDALAREREQLRQPKPAADAAATAARIAAIEMEQPNLAKQLDAAKAALPPVASDVATKQAESQRLAAELATVAAERQKAMHAIDAEVAATRAKLQAATTSAKDIERERWARFVDLGTALYTAGTTQPQLAQQVAAVTAEDERRAMTQATFDASMAQTQAMPPNTLRNFAGLTLLALLIVFGLPYATYSAWQTWKSDQGGDDSAAQQAGVPSINPMLEHELKTAAPYVLANRLSDAKSEEEAKAALLDLFRVIGLGVYTPGGRQILQGAERSAKDFYLYDFQLNILARTQIVPSYMEFFPFTVALGKAVTKLEIPEVFFMVLGPAIQKRYTEAIATPADPKSFLILFLDGLARRQPEPYTLQQIGGNNTDRLPISPIQSFLILIDFFMPPDPPRQAIALPWLRRLEPVAYAAAPCDEITISETAKKVYGAGYAGLMELAEEAFLLDKLGLGKKFLHDKISTAAAIFDNVSAIMEAAADLLVLYGLEVKVEAIPNLIHLRHEYTDVDGVITATVTFDPGLVHEDIINCGWLVGKSMPKKGPVPEIEISWAFSRPLEPHLALHPKSDITSSGSEGLKSKTDASGVSYFPLMASPCPDKAGRVTGLDYMAIVSARVLTLSSPTPSLIDKEHRPSIQALLPRLMLKFGPGFVEMFLGGRKGYTRFRAEWHEKPKKQYRKPGTGQ